MAESRPQNQEERRKESVAKIAATLATPITFYGKVIDQNGSPIADASINYTALDKFDESGSGYQGRSDSHGDFTISGITGAALSVGVRKQGYYPILDKSNASFAYGVGVDATRKAPPKKTEPAVFVLQKMGPTEPLLHVTSRQYKMSKVGDPIEINLKTGDVVALGQGALRLQRWANYGTKDAKGHFDWALRITVPGGGIVERKEQFAFEAPENGYTPSLEIRMPASAGDAWRYTVNKSYFVAMPSQYALLKLDVYGGHDNAVVMETFVNPTGSRNLEFDPAKQIRIR